MPLNNLGLGFVFTAKDLASGTMRKVEGRLNKIENRSKSAARTMKAGFGIAAASLGPLLAGLGALSAAFGLANAAGQFEQGLAAVGAVSRASSTEMAGLRDSAIQAGIATQFSPTEAVEGLTSLATAGQTAGQAMETLLPVLDLAAGSLGQLGVAGAAEAVVGTLNSYGQTAEHAVDVTDRLLRITQLSNFQARDFGVGLSKAAAAGANFNQDLNEVLITMGLLRNANIEASVASTSFREATRRLGSDAGAQAAIEGVGVKIFDEQTHRMRSFVDIARDLTDATRNMTDRERNRVVVQGFGARGLLAFNAIARATTTVMRDGRQVTLRGAEAIGYLRQQMSTAEGTAESFREQLLDTFEGQKTLLRGTIETIRVVFGEPFARVFKPFVGFVTNTLNAILQAFNNLPDGLKTAIAGLITVGSVVSILAGLFGVVTGVVIALSPFLATIVAWFAAAIAIQATFVAAVSAAALVVAGFVQAVRMNVGGIADFFEESYNRIRLVWRSLGQLFSDGYLSGSVFEELNRVENEGLKVFVIDLASAGMRVLEFLRGLKEGLLSGFGELGPVFEDMKDAFMELVGSFDLVEHGIMKLADSPLDNVASKGVRIGRTLASAFGGIVDALTEVVRFGAGFIKGFQRTLYWFGGPVFKGVYNAFKQLGVTLGEFFSELGIWTQEGGKSQLSFGEALGGTVAFLVSAFAALLTTVLHAVRYIVKGFGLVVVTARNMKTALGLIFLAIKNFVLNMRDSIVLAVQMAIAHLGRLANMVPESVRPAFLNDLVETGRESNRNAQITQGQIVNRVNEVRTAFAGPNAGGMEALNTAASEAAASRNKREIVSIVNELRADRARRSEEIRALANRPVEIMMSIDGEAVGSAVANSDRRAGAAAFVPVPAEAG